MIKSHHAPIRTGLQKMSATSTRDRRRTEIFVNAPPYGSQAQGLRRALPFCKRKSELSAVRQGADQFGNGIAPSVILAKPGKPCPRFAAHARPRAHRVFGQKEWQMCGRSSGPLTDSTPNPRAPAKARVRSRADWRKGSLDAWLRTGALLTPSDRRAVGYQIARHAPQAFGLTSARRARNRLGW